MTMVQTMALIHKSQAAAPVHEPTDGRHLAGRTKKLTTRDFDPSSLTPVTPLTSEEIRALRDREMVSQPTFARYLGVSTNLVSDWERGVKRPGGPALRLLTIVRNKGLEAIS